MTRTPPDEAGATCACDRAGASRGTTSWPVPASPSLWGRQASRNRRARGPRAGRTTAGARPSRVRCCRAALEDCMCHERALEMPVT